MTAAEVAQLFTANNTEKFTTTGERLCCDTSNGDLFASSDGSGGAAHLVVTLSHAPTIGAGQLLIIT